MKKEELLSIIQDKIKELFVKSENVDYKTEFFKTFREDYGVSIKERALTINVFDFIIAYLIANNSKYSLDELSDIMDELDNTYIDNGDIKVFIELTKRIAVLVKEIDINDIKEELQKSKSKRFLQFDDDIKELLTLVETLTKLRGVDIYPFMELFANEYDLMLTACAMANAFMHMRTERTAFESAKLQFELMHNCKPKNTEKLYNDTISVDFNMKEIKDEFDTIDRFIDKVISDEKNSKRKTRKELNAYMYLDNWFKGLSDDKEITNIPSEIDLIENKELRISILKYIYEHNMNNYKILENNYEDLLSNSYNRFKLLFEKYGIDISKYNIDITKNINETKSIIELLYSLNVKNSDMVIDIINNSKLERVENIKDLFYKGFISNDFFINNPSVFTINYFVFISNIELLKSEKLSVSIIKKFENKLLEKTEKLQQNIDILKDYDLFSKLSKSESFDFIAIDGLDERIDKVLELGFENLLSEDLSILNYDDEVYKRIIALNRLNIYIDNIVELKSILDKQKFVIPNDEIDDYIFDANSYLIEELEERNMSKTSFYALLEKYNNTPQTYNLNGVIISKNKVLRNLNNILNETLSSKEQLNSIIANMTLDKDELEKITKCLFLKEKQYKI